MREKKRSIFFLIFICVLTLGYVFRLANLQIIEGEAYREKSERRINRAVPVAAPRGEILDRYGRAFVKNRMAFSVQLDRVTLPKDKQNEVILNLLTLLENNGITYADSLPITDAPYEYTPAAAEDEDSKKEADSRRDKFLKAVNYKEGTSATEAMGRLMDRYKLNGYTEKEARKLAGIRYDMEKSGFSMTNPFVIATDIDMTTVTMLRERYDQFPGVTIETLPVREYVSGTTAAHLLGKVGKIYKEEAADYLSKGYLLSDVVGKDGVEKTMEEYLRGTPGEKIVEQNLMGKVTSTSYSVLPKPGNNVRLTIDKKLQEVGEASLEKNIKWIAERGKRADPSGRSRNGWDANAGAVIVQKVDTGEILVSASYPTFDPERFNIDYNTLSADPAKPLFNRAIGGAYEPGSTFKMATALAGLEEGVITPQTIIVDKGIYTYYKDYQPRCWVYSDYGRTHGNVDVKKAIQESCNYFFYETSRLMGIDKMNNWCEQLGMGQKTGIELPGESAGLLAGPKQRAKNGQQWWAGDTLQAAIGQSDNLLTPLQLASYVSTISNGGIRYQSTLLAGVNDYLNDEEVKGLTPIALNNLKIKDQNYQAIMEGMKAVTEEGTASNVFRNYPVKVGGKTGTATVPKGSPSGVFVAVAPLEDPEIVISIIVEHGTHGNYVAQVARDIFDAYFADQDLASSGIPRENEFLS